MAAFSGNWCSGSIANRQHTGPGQLTEFPRNADFRKGMHFTHEFPFL